MAGDSGGCKEARGPGGWQEVRGSGGIQEDVSAGGCQEIRGERGERGSCPIQHQRMGCLEDDWE